MTLADLFLERRYLVLHIAHENARCLGQINVVLLEETDHGVPVLHALRRVHAKYVLGVLLGLFEDLHNLETVVVVDGCKKRNTIRSKPDPVSTNKRLTGTGEK